MELNMENKVNKIKIICEFEKEKPSGTFYHNLKRKNGKMLQTT